MLIGIVPGITGPLRTSVSSFRNCGVGGVSDFLFPGQQRRHPLVLDLMLPFDVNFSLTRASGPFFYLVLAYSSDWLHLALLHPMATWPQESQTKGFSMTTTVSSIRMHCFFFSIPIAQFSTPPSPPHCGFPPLVSIRLFSTSVSQLLPCKPRMHCFLATGGLKEREQMNQSLSDHLYHNPTELTL